MPSVHRARSGKYPAAMSLCPNCDSPSSAHPIFSWSSASNAESGESTCSRHADAHAHSSRSRPRSHRQARSLSGTSRACTRPRWSVPRRTLCQQTPSVEAPTSVIPRTQPLGSAFPPIHGLTFTRSASKPRSSQVSRQASKSEMRWRETGIPMLAIGQEPLHPGSSSTRSTLHRPGSIAPTARRKAATHNSMAAVIAPSSGSARVIRFST